MDVRCLPWGEFTVNFCARHRFPIHRPFEPIIPYVAIFSRPFVLIRHCRAVGRGQLIILRGTPSWIKDVDSTRRWNTGTNIRVAFWETRSHLIRCSTDGERFSANNRATGGPLSAVRQLSSTFLTFSTTRGPFQFSVSRFVFLTFNARFRIERVFLFFLLVIF